MSSPADHDVASPTAAAVAPQITTGSCQAARRLFNGSGRGDKGSPGLVEKKTQTVTVKPTARVGGVAGPAVTSTPKMRFYALGLHNTQNAGSCPHGHAQPAAAHCTRPALGFQKQRRLDLRVAVEAGP